MQISDAYDFIANASNTNYGRFFSTGTSVGLGKGKVYSDAIYPLFDVANTKYVTVSGLVFILTHECDIEPENQRQFNEDVLIVPIIPLEDLVSAYLAAGTAEQLTSFLTNLGAKNISRLLYLPPISSALPYGGVIFLNQITNCHISVFENTDSIAAVTAFGLNEIELILENHLLRPKADRLAFMPEHN